MGKQQSNALPAWVQAENSADSNRISSADDGRRRTLNELKYSSLELTQAFGCSLRQLQWWDEKNVVSPKHDGHKRLYGRREALLVGLITRLREQFSLVQLRALTRRRLSGYELASLLIISVPLGRRDDAIGVHIADSPRSAMEKFFGLSRSGFACLAADGGETVRALDTITPALPMPPARSLSGQFRGKRSSK